MDAAQQLAAEEGVEASVVDLRSLAPWDRELVLDVVRRTGKVLVVHEDSVTGGVGAEIAATIASESFRDLDAPVRRVGCSGCPGAVRADAGRSGPPEYGRDPCRDERSCTLLTHTG